MHEDGLDHRVTRFGRDSVHALFRSNDDDHDRNGYIA
jgi:hypothetical protein